MDSDSEHLKGFYPDNLLPIRLSSRAARVAEDAGQLNLKAFVTTERLDLFVSCPEDTRSKREIIQDNIRARARVAPVRIRGR